MPRWNVETRSSVESRDLDCLIVGGPVNFEPVVKLLAPFAVGVQPSANTTDENSVFRRCVRGRHGNPTLARNKAFFFE